LEREYISRGVVYIMSEERGRPHNHMKYKVGDIVRTHYGERHFEGVIVEAYVTAVGKDRYIVKPEDGVVLKHSQFERHGTHITFDRAIELVVRKTVLPEDLFTL
jgi:hypothetical protein